MKKIIFTRSNLLVVALLTLLYLGYLFVTRNDALAYSFHHTLIDRYMLSQDIPHEVPGKRLFLSDSEIHIAAGYLYLHGNEPTSYNFQHPPFIKYLFGISTVLFNNPLLIQVMFGAALIGTTYLLAFALFKKRLPAVAAALLLLFDPLVRTLSGEALLDFGQSLFALLYVCIALLSPQSALFGGIILGLLAGSKFWAAGAFLFTVVAIHNLLRKKITYRLLFVQLLVAGVTFTLLYIPTFIKQNGLFNLPFFELKILKYWFHHSVTSIPFASLGMFMTGTFKTWWGEKLFTHSTPWTLVWPLCLSLATFLAIHRTLRRTFDGLFLIAVLPLLYLVYLGIQAPFPRYYVFILPYLYIASVYEAFDVVKRVFSRRTGRFSRQNKV